MEFGRNCQRVRAQGMYLIKLSEICICCNKCNKLYLSNACYKLSNVCVSFFSFHNLCDAEPTLTHMSLVALYQHGKVRFYGAFLVLPKQ